MTTRLRFLALAFILGWGGKVLAADVDLSGFEKILLPFDPTAVVSGVARTTFPTALVVTATEPVRFYPRGPLLADQAFGTFGIDLPEQTIAPQKPRSTAGRLLYVEKNKGDALHLQSWLMTEPVGAPLEAALWTALPVVRERDFRSGTVVFGGVPSPYIYSDDPVFRTAAAQFRYLLRLYDVDLRGDVLLRVRIYEANLGPPRPGTALLDTIVALSRREGTDPSQPYYAELPIDPLCHPFSVHTPCLGGTMRIDIEPVTPGTRYWALLSLTSNFTQNVMLFWPQ